MFRTDDIKELFGDVGRLVSASTHYDKNGKSLGSAQVVFRKKVDAIQAHKKYNNVPLDGMKMKIEIVVTEVMASSSRTTKSIGERIGKKKR